MKEIKKIDHMEQLRKNWMIIVAISGLIMAWANIQNDLKFLKDRLSNYETKTVALELKVDTNENKNVTDLSSISGDIREIKTSLVFIQQKLK